MTNNELRKAYDLRRTFFWTGGLAKLNIVAALATILAMDGWGAAISTFLVAVMGYMAGRCDLHVTMLTCYIDRDQAELNRRT